MSDDLGEDSRLSLTPEAIALYKFAVANPDWTAHEVCVRIGLTGERLASAIAVLHSNRLFRRSVDPDRVWDATGPKCALVGLMTDDEAKLRNVQRALLNAQDELMSLVPAYFAALRERALSEPIDVLHCGMTVSRLLTEQARQSASEVCVANPGHRAGDLEWLTGLGAALAELPGLSARFLLDHSTQANQEVQRHVSHIGRLGGSVRTVPSVPFELVLVDRCAAFLQVPSCTGDPDIAVVRHPTVVESFRMAFERLWSMATLFPGDDQSGREWIRDQLQIGILQHLAAGEKDAVIARRLGLSVRTCRRYIAVIMANLGANGRFQAGMLAQRLVFDQMGMVAPAAPPVTPSPSAD